MKKRLLVAFILLFLIAGGLVGFNIMRDRGIQGFFANMKPPAVAVSTYEVKPVVWTPVIDAIGTIYAARGIELTVEASGIVKEVGFTANQQVREGDLLLRLDDAVQRADLEATKSQAALDQQSLDRALELSQRGVGTSANLDSAEAQASASRSRVASLEAVLQQKRVVAPFSGTIGIPRVDLGQYVAPGTVVATLQDLDTLHADFTVPEQFFDQLEIGQEVLLGPEDSSLGIEGEITGIDPRVDPATRLVSVRAVVAESDGSLTPGQFVHVNVLQPKEDGVIAVPQTAVITSLYGDHVFAVRPVEGGEEGAQEARQVFVTVGRRSDEIAEIAKGLEPGDIVITAGQNRLSNGTPVTINNSVELGQTPPGDQVPAEDQAPDGGDATENVAPGGSETSVGTVTEDTAAGEDQADSQ